MRAINYLIGIFISFVCIFHSSAQVAQFETSFYFQDSQGNKDTIIIGADTTANNDSNPQLGMNLITGPWDSIFEVRVGNSYPFIYHINLEDTSKFYKKLIADPPFVPECGTVPNPVFLIYSKNYPVTITWDTSYWSINNTSCYVNGSFFYNWNEILEPGWWTSFPIQYGCLGLVDSFILDTTYHNNIAGITDSIKGVGRRFIYGLHLQPQQLYGPLSPCSYVLSIPELTETVHGNYKLFPNPTSEYINVIFSDNFINNSKKIIIINSQGKIVYHSLKNDHEVLNIPISNWGTGVYFIQVTDESGFDIETQKFIIIE